MKKIFPYIILMVFLLTSCEKEKHPFFNPSNEVISTMGQNMWLTIEVPQKATVYNFYSNYDLNPCYYWLYCNELLIVPSEMDDLAKDLSDTTIFQWESHSTKKDFPADHCKFLIGMIDPTIGINSDFVCSIGNDSNTLTILNELSKSVTGDGRKAFDEIIDAFENKKDEIKFDTANLDLLDMENIDGFWESNDIVEISYRRNSFYDLGNISGVFVGKETEKFIDVSVFLNQEAAKKSIEKSISQTSEIAHMGVTPEFDDPWWFYVNSYSYYLFINKRNTAISIYYRGAYPLDVETMVKNAAKEMVKQIENLCE